MRAQTPHAAAIDQVLQSYPGARRSGFSIALDAVEFLTLADGSNGEQYFEHDGAPPTDFRRHRKELGFGRSCGVVPDAFLVDFQTQTIIAFEAEDTFPVSLDKYERYLDTWWFLDDIEWELIVLGVNKWGGVALINKQIPTDSPTTWNGLFWPLGVGADHYESYEKPMYKLARIYTEANSELRANALTEFLSNHPHFRAPSHWISAETARRFNRIMGPDRK